MFKPTLVVCKPSLPDQYDVQRQALNQEIRGVEVFQMPIFKLHPSKPGLVRLKQILTTPTQDEKVDLLVFVSPSALELVLGDLNEWPAGSFCGVMGRQSAHCAQRLKVPLQQLIYPGQGANLENEDSNGLANLIVQRFPLRNCRIIVCKGPRGRTEFVHRLNHLQYEVIQIECYDRILIENQTQHFIKLFSLATNAVLWITSTETVQKLNEQLNEKFSDQAQVFFKQCKVLTTHARITAKCLELGYTQVFQIATGIQSVKEWLRLYQTPQTTRQ